MFIIFEGANGVGKTTLKNRFTDMPGFKTIFSPGSTPLAATLRPVCRGTGEWRGCDSHLQLLAFSTARTDEWLKHVKDCNDIVISDRWWTSTYVYQCMLEGFSPEFLEYTIHRDEVVDRVYIFHADPELLISRLKQERKENKDHEICTWTQKEETTIKVNEYYRYNLPQFLQHRNISYRLIDVTYLSKDDVFKQVYKDIMQLSATNQMDRIP